MAIAGKWLAAHFNQPGFEIFNYNVYAVCGDGDMMEGVASEAASLAGHLKLSNLCWIYDENHVTLDGPANVSFTEDVGERFLKATAGMFCTSPTPTICRCWRRHSTASCKPTTGRL